jgi:flagellar biosynthetic protein FlhB
VSQGDQDKTEQPTPYRLEEARKRGEIAKSAEAGGVLVMIAFAAILAMTGAQIAHAAADGTRRLFALAGEGVSLRGGFAQWVLHAYAPLWRALAPLLIGLVVTAVLGNLLQTGPMFTAHPLKPDAGRLNPAQAMKRIFSLRTLWELGKLLVKAGALGALGYAFVRQVDGFAAGVAAALPQRIGDVLGSAFVRVSAWVLLLLALVAVADLLFVRREFLRRMRMSRRELKDEVKRRDGDPAVRSKQKQQIRDLLKKTRALGRVRDADVVLTNPTHFAVALRYRPGQTLAPVVLAKGAGSLGGRIRALAARHRVPVRRLPALARALYRECEIGAMVPESLYGRLAPVYRELWAAQAAGAARGAAA